MQAYCCLCLQSLTLLQLATYMEVKISLQNFNYRNILQLNLAGIHPHVMPPLQPTRFQ